MYVVQYFMGVWKLASVEDTQDKACTSAMAVELLHRCPVRILAPPGIEVPSW